MGRSLSKERARVLKGMGFNPCKHYWVKKRRRLPGVPGPKYPTYCRIMPVSAGVWEASVNVPWGDDEQAQTFPDPITAAIWIALELSQEAGL